MMAKTVSVSFLLIGVGIAQADNDVIGTIDLTLDGEEQTWYVLEGPADTVPNALWLAIGPEKGALSVTAFDSPDIGLVRHESSGSAVPDKSAPALVISVAFPVGADDQSHILPTDADEGPAVIMLLKDWSNPLDSYTLHDGPGEIRLTSIDVNREGASQFTGSFQGVMRGGPGETMTIENGRIEIMNAEYFERR